MLKYFILISLTSVAIVLSTYSERALQDEVTLPGIFTYLLKMHFYPYKNGREKTLFSAFVYTCLDYNYPPPPLQQYVL